MHRALFAHAIFGFLCTAEGHSDYNAYRVWLAIKYFWGRKAGGSGPFY